MTSKLRPPGAPRSAACAVSSRRAARSRRNGFEAPGRPRAAAEPCAVGQQCQLAAAPDEFGHDEQPLPRIRTGGEVVEQVRQRVPGVFEGRVGDRGRACGREAFRRLRDPCSCPVGVEQQRPFGAHPQQGRLPLRDLRGHEGVPGVLGVYEQLHRSVPVPQALAVRRGRAVEQHHDIQVGPGGAPARQDTAAENAARASGWRSRTRARARSSTSMPPLCRGPTDSGTRPRTGSGTRTGPGSELCPCSPGRTCAHRRRNPRSSRYDCEREGGNHNLIPRVGAHRPPPPPCRGRAG